MILKTVGDLIKEYKRRNSFLKIEHSCGGKNYAWFRQQKYKINTTNFVYIVPGTDFETLPAGWNKTSCPECNEVFPEIDFEEVEHPEKEKENED